GSAGAGKAFKQEHGPVGNRLVEFRECRMTMFGPLVWMPATHRGDPCTLGHIFPPRGQSLLNLPERGRVFQDSVIAGTVSETHTMDMGLHQPWHDGTAAQIDDPN